MIRHMEPVSHLESIAIDRDGLTREDFLNDDGDEFSGNWEGP